MGNWIPDSVAGIIGMGPGVVALQTRDVVTENHLVYRADYRPGIDGDAGDVFSRKRSRQCESGYEKKIAHNFI